MSDQKIIQAWKNEEYRLSLSADEQALLPTNPAGLIELTDEALDDLVTGGAAMDSCCWSSCNEQEKPSPE